MNLVINDVLDAVAFEGFDEVAPLKRSFSWKTDIVQYENQKEQRNQRWPRPIRTWYMNWAMLDAATQDALIEVFHRARGALAVFLFKDRTDYACTYTECSITAIAGQTKFQLKKRYYYDDTEYFEENKTRIQPSTVYAPTIKVGAVTKTEGVDYTLDDNTGIVTFGAAPGAGAIITADFHFYFPVRFMSDTFNDVMESPGLYNASDITLLEVVE